MAASNFIGRVEAFRGMVGNNVVDEGFYKGATFYEVQVSRDCRVEFVVACM